MLRRSLCLLYTGSALAVVTPGLGAQITRDNYIDYLPPRPAIVSQTRASLDFRLFGDSAHSAYRDLATVDGIDDVRAAHLLRIAEHFSPLLRRNNFSVPRDLDAVLGPVHTLEVDTWRSGQRIRTDSIELGARPVARASSPYMTGAAIIQQSASPTLLQQVIRDFDPLSPRLNISAAEGQDTHILFFDMPGTDRTSWRQTYERLDPKVGSRISVHPFITEEQSSSRAARFQLVLQFWFFYPFNDAVNTREGDWEHINVLVTTRASAARAQPRRADAATMDSAALARILEEDYPVADSLVIAAVDYYFHESVVILDYLELTSPASTVREPGRHVWEDRDFVREVVKQRTTLAGGRLASHPIVYIGGNNKGPAELLAFVPRFHGSYKRNSGGSFPLPGVWETVGPVGATEKLYGGVVPHIRSDSTLEWYDLIDDDYIVKYRAADMTLLPDWERIHGIVMTNEPARQRWSWMILPIYWGFPVQASLGAGVVRHFDVGNIPPLSPPFHSTWNRIGASARHTVYRPRVLRTPVSPTSPWSMLQSGWGVLNVPLAAWGLMPGYNVALIQMMPWTAGAMNVLGSPPARTYTTGRLPRRFTTAGTGVFKEFGGRDFARVLPRNDSVIADRMSGATSTRAESRSSHARTGQRAWFNLYFHERLSLENTFSLASSDIEYQLSDQQSAQSAIVRGFLTTRQLTGGLRYGVTSALDETLQLYARAGYGWLWYRADNLSIGNQDLKTQRTDGGYLPPILPSRRWWPNTFYGGAGVEVFTPRSAWLFGLLGYGLRAEYTVSQSTIRESLITGERDFPLRRGDLGLSLVFGW